MDDGTSDPDVMTPDNYYLVTWDLVALPGIKGARLTPTTESLLPANQLLTNKSSISSLKESIERAKINKDSGALSLFRTVVESAQIPDKAKILEELSTTDTTSDDETKKKTDAETTETTDDAKSDDVTVEKANSDKDNELLKKVNDLADKVDKEEVKIDDLKTVTDSTQVDDVPGPINSFNMVVSPLDNSKVKKYLESVTEKYTTTESDDGTMIINSGIKLMNDLANVLNVPVEPIANSEEVPVKDTDSVVTTEQPLATELASTVVIDKDKDDDESSKKEDATPTDTTETTPIEVANPEDTPKVEEVPSIKEVAKISSPVGSTDDIVNSAIKVAVSELTKSSSKIIDTLESKLETLSNENTTLKNQLRSKELYYNSSLESKTATIKKLSIENSQLKSSNRRSINESVTYKKSVSESAKVIESLKKELTSTKHELSKATDKINVLSENRLETATESTIRKIKESLNDSKNKLTINTKPNSDKGIADSYTISDDSDYEDSNETYRVVQRSLNTRK